jgi:thymidylate kinase
LSLIYALRAVVLAYDRRRLLVKASRWAANGEIIVCDRYPSGSIGAMDSPRLQQDGTHRNSPAQRRVYNWLAGIEGRLYRQIPPPDLVLELKVSLDTAIARNHERNADRERDEEIASRHRQNKDWQLAGTRRICEVDADRCLAETVLRVKQLVWESI